MATTASPLRSALASPAPTPLEGNVSPADVEGGVLRQAAAGEREFYSDGLVNLLTKEADGGESFREELMAFAAGLQQQAQQQQQQAGGTAAAADPAAVHKLTVWRLADDPEVGAALRRYVARPQFGASSDPVCEWLYDWLRQSPRGSPLRRFVARMAPLAAAAYLLRGPGEASQPGLEALLVAVCEEQDGAVKGVSPNIDVTQPSVYHVPPASATQDMGASPQSLPQAVDPYDGDVPPAVQAVFSTSVCIAPTYERRRLLGGISASDRGNVAGAALQLAADWAATLSADAHADLAACCYQLAASGYPWLPEAVAKRAEQQLGSSKATLPARLAEPLATFGKEGRQARRVQLGRSLLQPLALGMARAAAAAVEAARAGGSGRKDGGSNERIAALTCAALALHEHCQYQLQPEGLLLSQALLEQIKQQQQAGGIGGGSGNAAGATAAAVAVAPMAKGPNKKIELF